MREPEDKEAKWCLSPMDAPVMEWWVGVVCLLTHLPSVTLVHLPVEWISAQMT